jgi:3-hydroxyisobutyrate dehydrogenase
MIHPPAAIGFVGLGIMGAPMAGHLLAAGYRLFVHTRTRAKAESLLAAGANWCDSPADVARACRLLCMNVPDTEDVAAVLFDARGAAGALVRGSIVVDFSTVSPAATRTFAARLAQAGVTLLDAPVTGGDVGARNAALTIMVGGEPAGFEAVEPVLRRLGKKIVHVGPVGSGQTLKACNQILCALNMIGVCEALSLARAAGLDPRLVIEVLGGGAGGSWALTNLGTKIVAGDLQPAFMVKLIQKDLRIVQDTAQGGKLPLPGTALAQQLFRAIEALPGGGELGTQAMIRAYEALRAAD